MLLNLFAFGQRWHLAASTTYRNDRRQRVDSNPIHSLEPDENLARAWGGDGQVGDQRNVVQQLVGALQLPDLEQTKTKRRRGSTQCKKFAFEFTAAEWNTVFGSNRVFFHTQYTVCKNEYGFPLSSMRLVQTKQLQEFETMV